LSFDLLAAAQAREFMSETLCAAGTEAVYRLVRATIPPYADDRPLGEVMAAAAALMERAGPP